MVSALFRVSSLLLGTLLLLVAVGSTSSLVPLVLAERGIPVTYIGWVGAAYNLGLALGGVQMFRFVGRVGHVRAYAFLAIVATGSMLALAVQDGVLAWLFARFVFGIAVGGLYMVIESWMNAVSHGAIRGRMLAVYMVVVYGGMALGQGVLSLPDTTGFTRFAVVAALLSAAALPVLVAEDAAVPRPVAGAIDTWRGIASRAWLALATAAVAGFTSGSVFAVAPIYGALTGLGPGQIGLLVTSFTIGGVMFQGPLGAASDLLDRRVVLRWVCAAAAGVSWLAMAQPGPQWMALVAAFPLGGAVFSLYSLALAQALDGVGEEAVMDTNARLLLVFCGCSAGGALVSAAAVEAAGPSMFFASLMVPTLVLALATVVARPPNLKRWLREPIRAWALVGRFR